MQKAANFYSLKKVEIYQTKMYCVCTANGTAAVAVVLVIKY